MGENWLRAIGDKPGVLIWRIDNKSNQLSLEQMGTRGLFKSDDCYILLDAILDINGGPNVYAIFTWVGTTSTVESYCNEKVDELKEKLAQECPITRETQEHESKKFLGFFKQGIQYVEPLSLKKQTNLREGEFPTKMYHLKGRREARVQNVEVSYKSMNSGDVFIVDRNDKIFQWNGKGASRMEKGKALDLTTRLRDERMNRLKAEVIVMKEGLETEEFWEAIGGKGEIATATAAGDDGEWEDAVLTAYKLFHIEGTAAENLKLTPVDTEGKHLHRGLLKAENSYLLDTGNEIFIWNGRTSSIKSLVQDCAQKYLESNNKPAWTTISIVPMGVEPALFRTHFRGAFTEYIDTPEAHENRLAKLNKLAGTLRQEKVNVDALLHPEKYRIDREEFAEVVPHAAKSTEIVLHQEFKIFLVVKKERQELPPEEYGIFYSGQAYVVQYTVRRQGGMRKFVVYYWQGRDASVDDKGSSGLLATDLASKFGRGATLVRVIQNKEPDHFLSHFRGYMMIRKGKRETWEGDYKDKNILYQVRGTNPMDATAMQVDTGAFSLNTNDSFVLDCAETIYVWHGKASPDHSKAEASQLTDKVQQTYKEKKRVVIEDGSETEDFWSALGGKGEYNNEPHIRVGHRSARLFQCTARTGVFKVLEIFNFTQDDLDDDDVMILDTFKSLYIWVGSKARKKEKVVNMASDVAEEYMSLADDGRDQESPIWVVDAGSEPIHFSSYFKGWSETRAVSGEDVYARRLQKLQKEGATLIGISSTKSKRPRVDSAMDTPQQAKLTASGWTQKFNPQGVLHDFDRLRAKPSPDGVDGSHLEAYLSDAQWDQFIKITREEFYKMPNWQQLRLKKSVGLF